MFKLSLSLCVVTFCTLPASAQVKLEWDLEKNKKFYVESRISNDQQIWFLQPTLSADEAARQAGTLMACVTQTPLHCVPLQWLGNRLVEGRQKVQHQTILEIEVRKSDKGIELVQKVVETRLNRSGIPPNNLLADKLKDAVCKVTLGPAFEIVAFDGYDDMIKAATKDIPEKDRDKEVARLRSILSEDALKQSARELFTLLPSTPVKPGDTWSGSEATEQLAPIGEVTRSTTFKYEGKDRLQHWMSFKSTVKLAPSTAPGGSLPFQVIYADLNFEKASGAIYFDPDKGRLANMSAMTRFNGLVTTRFIEAGEQTDLVTFVRQEIYRTVRVLDELPKKPTAP